eukprot:15000424-Alexandrium_andersonii.AAC.1
MLGDSLRSVGPACHEVAQAQFEVCVVATLATLECAPGECTDPLALVQGGQSLLDQPAEEVAPLRPQPPRQLVKAHSELEQTN